MKHWIIAAGLLGLFALPTAAHEVAKGPNGGRIADAGNHHLELVVKDRAVFVFVTDANEKALPATGFKGLAILTIKGKAQRITLAPENATHLSGSSPEPLTADVKGVVQITAPDGKTAQGRFQ